MSALVEHVSRNDYFTEEAYDDRLNNLLARDVPRDSIDTEVKLEMIVKLIGGS